MKKKHIHSKGLKEIKSRAKLSANGQTHTVAVIEPPVVKTPEYRIEKSVVTEFLPKPSVETSIQTEPIFDVTPEKFWRVGVWSVMSVAVVVRFLWLALKPFHHDEGVNGLFMLTMFREGVYKYDPSNYHGPSLYYFALFSTYIFGLNDFAVRLVTVVFGVLTVALVFSLRRYLGTIGTLFAASLVALSPGLTYFSRYFHVGGRRVRCEVLGKCASRKVFDCGDVNRFIRLSAARRAPSRECIERRKPSFVICNAVRDDCFVSRRRSFFDAEATQMGRGTTGLSAVGFRVCRDDFCDQRNFVYRARHDADRARLSGILAENLCK
jgi:Dolichyl-phosphate-mannose-protein mannosyltransferase